MSDTTKGPDWNNLRCLYAEDLPPGRKYPMTIAGIRDTPPKARLFCRGDESKAWDVAFTPPGKDGRTLYIQVPSPNEFGKRAMILRTYVMACGGEPDQSHVGKTLYLHSVPSKKSDTGRALRIASPEGSGS